MPSSCRIWASSARILVLDAHVQGRRGFVRKEQGGAGRDRQGDHHPLTHASAQLMGVVPQPTPRLRDAHPFQQLQGPCLSGSRVQAKLVVEGLAELVADRKHWVEA